MSAKNIGIAQPRKENPKKRIAKETNSYFLNNNSTMNSFFNFGSISTRRNVKRMIYRVVFLKIQVTEKNATNLFWRVALVKWTA